MTDTNKNEKFADVFTKGCLVNLTMSCYSGTVQIPKKIIQEKMDSEYVKGSKYLLPKNALDTITSIIGETRNWLNSVALPFPIRSAVFAPFDMVEYIDNGLQIRESRYNAAVEDFCSKYEELREEIRPALVEKGLYNETDYPMDIRSRFGFNWRFITINTPGESSVLSPAFVKREQEKFRQTLLEARDMATQALRVEFSNLINNAVDRLTLKDGEKKKIFKASTVENFNEFFETFTSRNCFGDEELKKLVEQAEDIMFGVTPEDMRSNDGFRKEISESLAKVQGAMETTIAGRKLNFED